MDRSGRQLTNRDGSYRDRAVGQCVEVMYLHDRESTVVWSKVEAACQNGFESLLARVRSMNPTDPPALILCMMPLLRNLALVRKRLAARGRRC